jgi:hypothetical protein
MQAAKNWCDGESEKTWIWMTSKRGLVVQNNTHNHACTYARDQRAWATHTVTVSLSLSATTSPTEMMKRFQEDVRPLGNSDGMETDADARMVFSVRMAFFLGLAEH